jgi:hypothetical protein
MSAFWFSILRSSSSCGVSDVCLILLASASPLARVSAALARVLASSFLLQAGFA